MTGIKTGEAILFPDPLLAEIRSKFAYVEECPYAGKRIFLDSASGSLRLKALMDVAEKELLLPDQFARPVKGSKHCHEVMLKGEEDVRLFLGAKTGMIIPSKTATEGLFRFVRNAADYFPGANIVTTVIDHPSTYDSTRLAAETLGKQWRVAQVNRVTGFVDTATILDLVDKDTSVLAFIHGSNITGALMDAKEIVQEARKIKKDLCIIVDGVQYAPHAPVDVEDIGADVYLFGCYKAYTRRGIAFAHLSERFARIPHEKLFGKKPYEWALGSLDQFDYASWSCVTDYLCWLGGHFTASVDRREQLVAAMTAMEAHEVALLQRLLYGTKSQKGLKQMKRINIHGIPEDLSRRSCLVAFNIQGMDTNESVARYVDYGIAVTNRKPDAYSKHMLESLGAPEIIRLSAAHYTLPQEIDAFLEVTEKLQD